MQPCVPFASTGDSLRENPSRSGFGGPGLPTSAMIAAALCLLPLEAPAQHFYSGVGYGLERPPEAKPADGNCGGARRIPGDGCGAGEGLAPFLAFENPTVALGLDSHPGPATVTIEGLAGDRPEFAFEDRADSGDRGERQSLSRFIAPSFDIPAIGALGERTLNTFLGGGLGAVRTGSGEIGTSFAEPGPLRPSATRVGSAWMVTAGVAASLDARTTVELAWRYEHLGGTKTGRGSGRVEWRDRGRPIPTNMAPTSAEAQSHGVRLSLRYGF